MQGAAPDAGEPPVPPAPVNTPPVSAFVPSQPGPSGRASVTNIGSALTSGDDLRRLPTIPQAGRAPATENRPATESRPAAGNRPATEGRPAAEGRSATESRPATESFPATGNRPAAESFTATEDRPAVESRPAPGPVSPVPAVSAPPAPVA